MGQERRKTPRYPFRAFAEIVKDDSSASVTSQVSELSLYGCFLQKTNPFAAGTSLHIKIFTETEFFESRATVAYALPDQGMGVMFHNIRPAFVKVLRKWILEAMSRSKNEKS